MAAAASPPSSPVNNGQRPMSAMMRRNRSASRMSVSSNRHGAGSRSSDEDGKTAVKVAVRVRPPLQPADPGYDLVPQRFRGSTIHVTAPTSLTVESAQGKKLFVFDRVFGHDVDQEGVWDYLSESVGSFVQGYNVSILAYGQSGAGKSYTMGTTGPEEQNDARIMGVVPRAAAALFEKLTGAPAGRTGIRSPMRYSTNGLTQLQNISRAANKNWQMKATYVEIYQEHLRDLLVDETVPYHERPQVMIREDPKGRILLTGLKQVPIESVEDLLNALNFGSAIRQTDSTAVNARSSRSHAVFSLNLIQKRSAITPVRDKRMSVPLEAMSGSDNWVTVDSKLHFVDLAGSERLKNTGAQGERAKEGISINAGLASLGKVIAQLSSRQPGAHVSYRDSKLTRLLQDSLGGNAITYMVACVNPVEFHLSETLNTVQYAQRARAIQIKPQIQQVSDDSDKQAVIDRLRAEISFLRDQIRLSERSERKSSVPKERDERSHGREVELQDQLLDIQENYNALSQRHAKLISEITKARDDGSEETPVLKSAIGDIALERLKRSNSFAEAVEQVVLEYEKTIQTLEASLSNTRTSLANTESTLLEKETNIAYMETFNQQLQSRIKKAIDREANDENYLRDLEARVAGAATGEEKNNAVIASLRKELARARENEASCEEYISTLEERLAEAEQDHEMMQREIDRLEHVVERQRSIGKLDNLLYELDHIRQTDTKAGAEPVVNGHSKKESAESFHSFARSDRFQASENGDTAPMPIRRDSVTRHPEGLEGIDEREVTPDADQEAEGAPVVKNHSLQVREVEEPTSPAQSKFVADKLDTVTQELFDLRVEHESTVHDFDELQRKYQIALQALAELQDSVEDARREPRSRPASTVTDGAARLGEDGQQPSARSLSSELSKVGELPDDDFAEKDEPGAKAVATNGVLNELPKDDLLAQEMEKLKELNTEKENAFAELAGSYAELQEKHQDTLDYVEELKAEVQKAQLTGRLSPQPQIIRRKSSQNITTSDRANRSFASLRNIALEYFEDEPDMIQSFELNLNAAMTELHIRSERVAALEGEVASLRREMETKMTIISGLTRERSSLTASSPLDVSALSTMHDQLLDTENRIRKLSESHAAREQEMQQQIDHLKNSLSRSVPQGEETTPTSLPGGFPETPAEDANRQLGAQTDGLYDERKQRIDQLQKEVASWRTKHDSATESMKASEKQLLTTITDLETSLHHLEQQSNASRSTSPEDKNIAIAAQMPQERKTHQEALVALQKEVDEHKSGAAAAASRLTELEQSHSSILRQLETDTKSRELTEKELQTHRDLVANLENQLDEHKNAIATHQQGLEALRDSHSHEIERLTAASLTSHADADMKLNKALEEHKSAMGTLQAELERSRAEHAEKTTALQAEVQQANGQLKDLLESAAALFKKPTDASNLTMHIQSTINARKDILALHESATNEIQDVRQQLEVSRADAAEYRRKFEQLKLINDETIKELERVSEKERKSSRLVEELEEQLNSNFDQHKAANHRLSALQQERQAQVEDMRKELEESRAKRSLLEAELMDARRRSYRESLEPNDADLHRSNSGNSTNYLRKSVSAGSLPSPPPAIPLPPLPGNPHNANNSQVSPPTSRHQSKDIAQAQLAEDQEARIRTIEKHLFAEKQLTATLEEALTDLESSSTKMKSEMEAWRRKCVSLEDELTAMRKQRESSRLSVQQLEEERNKSKRLEMEQQRLQNRLEALANNKKNKKAGLNCF